MTSMKYEIRENTRKLQRIENMLNDMKSSKFPTNNGNDYLVENTYFNIFPLKNIDELNELEDKLNNDDFRLNLVIYNILYLITTIFY